MSISVSNITKLYGAQKALDGVSLEIMPGGIAGLLGPNGAGKSTLMKILTCYIPPTDGSATVCGFDVMEESLEVRKRGGYLPENNPLYLDLYVKEFLEFIWGISHFGSRIQDAGSVAQNPNPGPTHPASGIQHPASAKGPVRFRERNRIGRVRIHEVIELTGLGSEQHKRLGELSKGYRQRVGLAQALLHDPEVLILDEPTSGLDPNQLEEIRNLIRAISTQKTVLLSTHIMQEVENICDRVIIIHNGKIVADDTTRNLQNIATDKVVVRVEFDRTVEKLSLMKITGVRGAALQAETTWLLTSDPSADIRPAVFKFAVENGLTVLSLQREEQKLEEVFRELTKS